MKDIAIFTLTSALHDEIAVAHATCEFLGSLHIDHELHDDFQDYGKAPLSLIYVRTGGTEGVFKSLLPQIQRQATHPIYLLTSGKSNSLAASMEILSFLRQQGIRGEIIHGSSHFVSQRIALLTQVSKAKQKLSGNLLGIIGSPSDWLISSHANKCAIEQKIGIKLVDIAIKEVLDVFNIIQLDDCKLQISPSSITNATVTSSLPNAIRIYHALQHIVRQHGLSGFTIRCFDLLTAIHNTGCLALAQLNSEGIIAGCEGDIPAALTMLIAQSLIGVTGFQANPSEIDPENGTITLAHCTIPLNMVSQYELDTHYESGIGVGIRGFMPTGPVTLFKASGDLSRHFVAEGQLLRNESKPDLCRTQQIIQLNDASQTNYFLTNPIGNHHIVLPGHNGQLLQQFMNTLS